MDIHPTTGTLFEFCDADWGWAVLPAASAFHGSHAGGGDGGNDKAAAAAAAAEGKGGDAGTNDIVFGHVNELAWLVVDTCEVRACVCYIHTAGGYTWALSSSSSSFVAVA